MTLAVSLGQAAANALAAWLHARLPDVVVESRWPEPHTKLPPKAVTVLLAGPPIEELLDPVVVGRRDLTGGRAAYLWSIRVAKQPMQLDVWTKSDVARDDLVARLTRALNASESESLGVRLSDPVRNGVLLRLGDGWDGFSDFLVPSSQNDVQRVGLSATVGNPDEILTWLKGSSKREGVVVDPPKNPSTRDLFIGLHESVAGLASEAAARASGRKSLFFCQSRSLTETVAERMRGSSIDVFVHHSSVSLEERRAAEERFAHGTNACIVCTSTLELGIDVGDLDLVFQANAPSSVSSFMQRMGRTGRREGATANTTFLCDDPEAVLQAVALVELAREGWVERVAQQDRCWPVLVHQLLAMTLQYGAISADRCWEQFTRVPDFRSITREEFDETVEHMKREEFLFESGGLLSMGTKAERVFGRKNFLELYAVFSSPVLYRVLTAGGRDLGSLEQNFVDRLVDQMSSFLLGGRAWTVERVRHDDRVVVVRQAPGGVKPSWGGFIPQFLGLELCQRMKQALTDTARYPYVDEQGSKHIEEKRDSLGELLRQSGRAVQVDEGVARWWTFAGGRVNHTLKYGFEVGEGWKVVADNFQLRVEGDGVGHESVRRAIKKMSSAGFWDSPDMRRAVLARLPGYRLSKFQDCLPEKFALEVIEKYLLDVAGTIQWLGGSTHPSEVELVPLPAD